MSSILIGILAGISSNFDNIGVGLSYGIRKSRILWLFSILTGFMSFSVCVVGSMTAIRIGSVIPASTSHLLGSFILVCIGFWTIMKSGASYRVDFPRAIIIGFSEMMFILLAQVLSDLSIGFGTGFARLNTLGIAFSVSLLSFLFFCTPAYLGYRLFPLKLGKNVLSLSGFLLIVVGLAL